MHCLQAAQPSQTASKLALPSSLSTGTHTIGVTTTDPWGATGTASITVQVQELVPIMTAYPLFMLHAEQNSVELTASASPGSAAHAIAWSLSSSVSGFSYSFLSGSASSATAVVGNLPVGNHTITLTLTTPEGSVASTSTVVSLSDNHRPIAVANSAIVDGKVVLDATGSIDPDADGFIADSEWRVVSTTDERGLGAAYPLEPERFVTELANAGVATYTMELWVKDDRNAAATATTSITLTLGVSIEPTSWVVLEPGAPLNVTAVIAADEVVADTVVLAWSFVEYVNPVAGDAGTAVAVLSPVPNTNLAVVTGLTAPGNYTLKVTATADGGPPASATVTVRVNTKPVPVVRTLDASSFTASGGITLDGSASYDADGSIDMYWWEVLEATTRAGVDPVGIIDNNQVATTAFGPVTIADYVVRLYVWDNNNARSEVVVALTVPLDVRTPPAVLKYDVDEPSAVTTLSASVGSFSSSVSVPADLTYQWVFVEHRPVGDRAAIASVAIASPTSPSISVPSLAEPGTYVFMCTVTAPTGAQTNSTSTIKINMAPEAVIAPYDPSVHFVNDTGFIIVNASASVDLDGSIVTAEWVVVPVDSLMEGLSIVQIPGTNGLVAELRGATPGNYTVKLNVTDENGRWTVAETSMHVHLFVTAPDVLITCPGDASIQSVTTMRNGVHTHALTSTSLIGFNEGPGTLSPVPDGAQVADFGMNLAAVSGMTQSGYYFVRTLAETTNGGDAQHVSRIRCNSPPLAFISVASAGVKLVEVGLSLDVAVYTTNSFDSDGQIVYAKFQVNVKSGDEWVPATEAQAIVDTFNLTDTEVVVGNHPAAFRVWFANTCVGCLRKLPSAALNASMVVCLFVCLLLLLLLPCAAFVCASFLACLQLQRHAHRPGQRGCQFPGLAHHPGHQPRRPRHLVPCAHHRHCRGRVDHSGSRGILHPQAPEEEAPREDQPQHGGARVDIGRQ